jgi:hypothetical protein
MLQIMIKGLSSRSPKNIGQPLRGVGLLFIGGVAIATTSLPVTALAEAASGDGGQSVFISGIAPDRRPEGAPTIAKFQKTDGWYQQALKGIDKPYPASLGFLEDQEGWFVPFNHRGMSGRYDIRNLHK